MSYLGVFPRPIGSRRGVGNNAQTQFNGAAKIDQQQKDSNESSETKFLQSTDAKRKKWTTRDTIDTITVAAYAGIVGFAIFAKGNKTKMLKLMEKQEKLQTKKGVISEDITNLAKSLKGETSQGTRIYKFFDWCGKLKENSAELTNNVIYGLGTLIIMPIVILFSPVGKKDTSKEDKVFTVLRQPISFATVFAMQLTFDKFFKSMMNELNLRGLLDGTKDKKGKEIFFNEDRVNTVLSKKFENIGENKNFNFDKGALENIKNEFDILKKIPTKDLKSEQKELKSVYEKTLDVIDIHINGGDLNFVYKHKKNLNFKVKANGNIFGHKDFIKDLTGIICQFGETKPTKNQLSVIKSVVANYTQQIPDLPDLIDNAAKCGYRTKVIKQVSAVIANSIASQALGIMMLNFLYGKIMKARQKNKLAKASITNNTEGGQK